MEWYLAAAAVLVGLGMVQLVCEFFLPTGGLILVGAVACFAGAVALLWLYGSTTEAIAGTVGLSLGTPVAAAVMFAGWRRLALKSALDADADDNTLAATPEIGELAWLIGTVGKTLSPLRPAGIAQFDNRRVDCVSQGMMVGPGEWVKCVEVRGATVVVRKLDGERADTLSDLAIDDL
jgi:membrane-bound serine protease (ClpP class)